ncbi:hypothetical protein RclHR1_13560004 [Rhizophagus clarus]|uniref:Uncharacterized protein n=1 Tax=Rhizophagus clarus TaxID=94130 RepID=A0A2Z6QMQ1_9GLOM|nr:hypothetical protein RclHR1_13560004 [Rhizophagus clarus]
MVFNIDDWFLEHLDAVFGKTVFKFLLRSIGYWQFSGDYLKSLDLDFNNFSSLCWNTCRKIGSTETR